MPKRYKNSWTPEEDGILKKCVSEGMISKEIQPYIPKRGVEAIAARRRTLGLKKPDPVFPQDDPATVAQIVKFRMADWRLEDIEAVTGVCRTRLSWLVVRQGIRVRPVVKMPASNKQRWTEVEIGALRRCLRKKMSLDSLCLEFPHRTARAIQKKAYQITRYWLLDEEHAERERLRKKQLRVY
ncbi:hypothetical protein C6499_12740 [Candidatus Poribacteria bacterium]|nr:MAG: hypothetical protein C6499_12740 [Candidatus Poribacteria bacterium]